MGDKGKLSADELEHIRKAVSNGKNFFKMLEQSRGNDNAKDLIGRRRGLQLNIGKIFGKAKILDPAVKQARANLQEYIEATSELIDGRGKDPSAKAVAGRLKKGDKDWIKDALKNAQVWLDSDDSKFAGVGTVRDKRRAIENALAPMLNEAGFKNTPGRKAAKEGFAAGEEFLLNSAGEDRPEDEEDIVHQIQVMVSATASPEFDLGPNGTFVLQLPSVDIVLDTDVTPSFPRCKGVNPLVPKVEHSLLVTKALGHKVFDPKTRTPQGGAYEVETRGIFDCVDIPGTVDVNAEWSSRSMLSSIWVKEG